MGELESEACKVTEWMGEFPLPTCRCTSAFYAIAIGGERLLDETCKAVEVVGRNHREADDRMVHGPAHSAAQEPCPDFGPLMMQS